ncbi:Uncharacterized protein At4g28440, partial [Linum perenne]
QKQYENSGLVGVPRREKSNNSSLPHALGFPKSSLIQSPLLFFSLQSMATTAKSNQHQHGSNNAASAAAAGNRVVEKRKPVFVKVQQLKPGTQGHNLIVKVLSSNPVSQQQQGRPPVSQRLRNNRIAECLIGDETGTILFTARNDQVDMMKPGTTVIIRNSKIDMFKGSMRLAVDKWGRIEVTEPAKFVVNEDNNLSLVEYELVTVADD